MTISNLLLILAFISYFVFEFLLFRYMRQKNFKGLIPVAYNKLKKRFVSQAK